MSIYPANREMLPGDRLLLPKTPYQTEIVQRGEFLMAVSLCCACRISFSARMCWECSKCSEALLFQPDRKANTANYYSLERGDKRYSLEEWVSSWTGFSVSDLAITTEWDEG